MRQRLFFRVSIYVIISFAVVAGGGVYNIVSAQTAPVINYKAEATSLYNAIKLNYFDSSTGYYKEFPKAETQKNAASYLWPLCAIFQAENELEAGSKSTSLVTKTFSIISRYYDTRVPAPGYASYPPPLGGGDRFYDDNQWIGITLLDVYQRTNERSYLDKGKEIFRFMMTAYDTISGGGLYWEEGKPTKNTCSNGPGILLALQLYKATHTRSYLDTALMLYDWVNKNLYDGGGLYYDNTNTKTGRVDQKRYSYNTATMLQSNVYLFELTGKQAYLDSAIIVAEAAHKYFYTGGKFKDNIWFNAVMLRAYIHLAKFHPDKKYIQAFQICTNQLLRENKNENHLIGKHKVLDLVSQGGMLEILARFSVSGQ